MDKYKRFQPHIIADFRTAQEITHERLEFLFVVICSRRLRRQAQIKTVFLLLSA